MSDKKPSIAELKRIEHALPGPWSAKCDGYIEAPNPDHPNSTIFPVRCNRLEDTKNVCALRNAAPVLLEIAAAALLWAETRKVPGIAAEREAAYALIAALAKAAP